MKVLADLNQYLDLKSVCTFIVPTQSAERL